MNDRKEERKLIWISSGILFSIAKLSHNNRKELERYGKWCDKYNAMQKRYTRDSRDSWFTFPMGFHWNLIIDSWWMSVIYVQWNPRWIVLPGQNHILLYYIYCKGPAYTIHESYFSQAKRIWIITAWQFPLFLFHSFISSLAS